MSSRNLTQRSTHYNAPIAAVTPLEWVSDNCRLHLPRVHVPRPGATTAGNELKSTVRCTACPVAWPVAGSAAAVEEPMATVDYVARAH